MHFRYCALLCLIVPYCALLCILDTAIEKSWMIFIKQRSLCYERLISYFSSEKHISDLKIFFDYRRQILQKKNISFLESLDEQFLRTKSLHYISYLSVGITKKSNSWIWRTQSLNKKQKTLDCIDLCLGKYLILTASANPTLSILWNKIDTIIIKNLKIWISSYS